MDNIMQHAPNKILYIHNSEKIGGGNKVLLGLFDSINRDRYEPFSLLPSPGAMEDELKKRDVSYLIENIIDCNTSGSCFYQLYKIATLHFKFRNSVFQIMHAQGPLSYRLSSFLARSNQAKRICHLHFPATDNQDVKWAFRRKPDLLVACSQHVAETFEKRLKAQDLDVPILVAHNFVDEEYYCPGPPSIKFKQELLINGDKLVVTIIGLVSERKGHPQFIEMARMLLEERKDVVFLVVGEDILSGGKYRNEMEKLATQLQIDKDIVFLGFRTDVLDIIRSSDVVVLPSHSEGMPMSILEVGACAKPVVAFRIPGVDEVLFDGINGVLVEENNVAALARAVNGILLDQTLKKKLGECARKLIEEKFTLNRYTQKIEQIYEKLLAGS